MKALIAEDNSGLANSLSLLLTARGFYVDVVPDGLSAWDLLRINDYDLLILDWMMPGKTGVEICNQYRRTGGNAFIMMLTGQTSVEDKVKGLDTGADDYVTKPFDTEELVSRIQALFRRPAHAHADLQTYGTLSLDGRNLSVTHKNKTTKLTRVEFAILECLLSNPEQVFSAERIVQLCWPAEKTSVQLQAVYTAFNRLRKSLLKVEAELDIQGKRGSGYCLHLTKEI